MPAVRMEDEAFSDERFEHLAKLCQLADADHARGKMAKLWRECTKRHSYVLDVDFVCIVLGENGAASIVKSQLGEVTDGGIRVRGTKGRIEWLKKLKKNASKGGKAKSAKRQALAKQKASKALADSATELATPCPLTISIPTSPSLSNSSSQTQIPEAVPVGPAPSLADVVSKTDAAVGEVGAKRAEPVLRARAEKTRFQPAIDAFHSYFADAHGGATPTWDPKRCGMVKTLVGKHGLDEVVRRIGVLRNSPPGFPKPPWDLPTFVQHFDKCAGGAANANNKTGRVEPMAPHEYPEGDVAL